MPDELYGKDPDEMTLIIAGREVVCESMKLLRTMNTCADGLTAVLPWEPGLDAELDKITAPYSYSECSVYLGGKFQMAGLLYNVAQSRANEGTRKDLEIYSKTADIIDSTIIPPYEANNISLTARCKQQCEPFGIEVVLGDGVNLLRERRVVTRSFSSAGHRRAIPAGIRSINRLLDLRPTTQEVKTNGTWRITGVRIIREEEKFRRVSAEQTDMIFEHLRKLAAQKGLLLSCTKWGDLLITKANVDGEPVGTITEESPLAMTYSASFSGRDRFAMYRALAPSSRSRRAGSAGVVRDPVVTAPRVLTFQADDNLPGEAPNAAVWRKNKSAADSMNISFPVTSWYAPNGKLWEPNTTVTVISPTIGLKGGFTFLITQVEYNFSASGANATLQLKPPTTYTTGEVIEPWLSE